MFPLSFEYLVFLSDKSTYPNAYFPNGSIYRNQCSYCRKPKTNDHDMAIGKEKTWRIQ